MKLINAIKAYLLSKQNRRMQVRIESRRWMSVIQDEIQEAIGRGDCQLTVDLDTETTHLHDIAERVIRHLECAGYLVCWRDRRMRPYSWIAPCQRFYIYFENQSERFYERTSKEDEASKRNPEFAVVIGTTMHVTPRK